APWCGPCRLVVPIVEEISRERPDIKVGKINVDEQPELAARFQVAGIPTLAVIRNGKMENRVTGYRPKSQIEQLL
ncbi:MAG TPA: thiol reductase thioredoxin, partial [Erysipelotrichaceae bacterium]|nr:thiol reductase thioredoxin [Erysipelotrichaceae bacterium]